MRNRGLTLKQRIFIVAYLADKNATKAAKVAGYSAKTARSAGSRLLTNVDISAAIERGMKEQLNRVEVSADLVLKHLRRIAFAEVYHSNQLKALEIFGKALGIFQKEVDKSNLSESSLTGDIADSGMSVLDLIK